MFDTVCMFSPPFNSQHFMKSVRPCCLSRMAQDSEYPRNHGQSSVAHVARRCESPIRNWSRVHLVRSTSCTHQMSSGIRGHSRPGTPLVFSPLHVPFSSRTSCHLLRSTRSFTSNVKMEASGQLMFHIPPAPLLLTLVSLGGTHAKSCGACRRTGVTERATCPSRVRSLE